MDLSKIINQIQREECVLLIGTEMPFLTNKLERQEVVLERLTEKRFDLIQFKEDDFYYFLSHNQKLKACDELLDLYSSFSIHPLYTKIAEIPFSLVISLSPDNLLKQAFTTLFGESSCEFGYYKKGSNKDIKTVPTINHPAVYNLLGDISQDIDSVILTFDDLFGFLSSVFGDYKLPTNIKLKLQSARAFIFIGFKFHAWYYKLLLRILGIDESKVTYYCPDDKVMDNISGSDKVLFFFDKHFDMQYSPLNVEEFINELHKQTEKIRHTKATVLWFDNAKYKSLISSNLLDEAIQQLEKYLVQTKDTENINTFSIILNDYNSYKNTEIKGTEFREALDTQRRVIVDRLLNLGDKIN